MKRPTLDAIITLIKKAEVMSSSSPQQVGEVSGLATFARNLLKNYEGITFDKEKTA